MPLIVTGNKPLIVRVYVALDSIARHVQKHQRLLSVVESLDNGKPIRESRDADVQIVVRHLYHHAGWAQLTDTEMADWKPLGQLSYSVQCGLISLSNFIEFSPN